MTRQLLTVSGVLAILWCITPVCASDRDGNLVTNGDAEIGTMDGWTPVDQVEIVDTSVPGVDGLPGGYSIGAFSFSGGLGSMAEACSQSVDVSMFAGEIDAGLANATMSGAVQSRTAAGFFDTIVCTFEFLDDVGTALLTTAFDDESIVEGINDWHLFDQQIIVPAGTRTIEVTLSTLRTIGLSTDAYADNICVVLDVPSCPGDLDGDGAVGVGDLLDLLAAWGPCPGCPEDLDGDGSVGVTELLAVLAAWGPCP